MTLLQSAVAVYAFYLSLFSIFLSALYPLLPCRLLRGGLLLVMLAGGAPAVWLCARIRGGASPAVLQDILAEALAPFQMLFYLLFLSF